MMTLRVIISIAILPLPWVLRRWIYSRILGFELAQGAYIGRSIIAAKRVRLRRNSRIGSLTVIRNLDELILDEDALIGSFNWVHGYVADTHFKDFPDRVSRLHLSNDAAITARHIVDCTDEVFVGAFATVAGHRTQILTHSISIGKGTQTCAPVRIGRYAFIGTGCIITKGARFPEHAVLAAGSTFNASSDQHTFALYAGNPAMLQRKLDPSSRYFTRAKGIVG